MALTADVLSDEELLSRYQAGDRQAFGALVRRHERGVFNYVLRSVRSPSTAEDLCQEVFLRVVQGAGDFRHSSKVSTWVYTIARNLCVDQARRARHRSHDSLDQPKQGDDGSSRGDLEPDRGHRSSVERSYVGTDVARRVEAIVEQLPEEQREVFLLRELADLPFQAIADMLGIPENTAKSRMRYALDRLRRGLAEYEEHARTLESGTEG